MEQKHLGARNELAACAWLLTEGYEVFRNVSQHGKIDLIAIKDGKVHYFDVKGATKNAYTGTIYTAKLSAGQLAIGVKALYVLKDGTCWIDWEPNEGKVYPKRDYPLGTCRVCTAKFKPSQSHQVYCSPTCRSAYYKAAYG